MRNETWSLAWIGRTISGRCTLLAQCDGAAFGDERRDAFVLVFARVEMDVLGDRER